MHEVVRFAGGIAHNVDFDGVFAFEQQPGNGHAVAPVIT